MNRVPFSVSALVLLASVGLVLAPLASSAHAQDGGSTGERVVPEIAAPEETAAPEEVAAPEGVAAPEVAAPVGPATPVPSAASPRPPLVPPGGVPEVGGTLPETTPAVTPEVAEPAPLPPIPTPRYSVEAHVRLSFPEHSSFDRALEAHRYGGTRVSPVGYFGISVPVVEWLWLGGRLGARGRSWGHPDYDDAYLAAADLLLTAQVRFVVARVIELGVLLAGGASYMTMLLNDQTIDQLMPRFGLEAVIAFRIGSNFAIGPRVGWDYFQWDHINAYDHGVDLGGAFLGISLEARE